MCTTNNTFNKAKVPMVIARSGSIRSGTVKARGSASAVLPQRTHRAS